ncbi:MAG: hypothetical protein ACYCYL_01375 [Acidithiobacillus sp.]
MHRNIGNWMAVHPKQIYASAKDYHRRHPWKMNRDGLMVRHLYTNMTPEKLSWWDDVGFVFAKRRIMVWWLHPRMVYEDRLEDLAVQRCAEEHPKEENWLMRSEPITRKVGKGRRVKTVGHSVLPMSEEYRRYYDKLEATQVSLAQQDHGWIIAPSIRSRALDWCQGVDLVLPVEVRCEGDLRLLRGIVERHLRGDRNVLAGYPAYTFADWQVDQDILSRQKEREGAA